SSTVRREKRSATVPPSGPSSTYGRSLQMVAAPTQTAEWVALYTYPSSAALYSQLPISEAALAPISARAAGTTRTCRYARAVVSPIAGDCRCLRAGGRHLRGPDWRFCRGEVGGAVQQRLAAQAAGDLAGFSDGRFGGAGVEQSGELLRVIQESVGQVIRGGVLAQAGDRGGERRSGGVRV